MPPRKTQTFPHQHNICIITNYREFKSPTALKRESASTSNCHQVSYLTVTLCLELSANLWPPLTSPSKLPGLLRTKIIKENIDIVRNLVEVKPNSSIFKVSTAMNLSMGRVWNISRKTLIKYPYKPKTLRSLTDQHKRSRVHFLVTEEGVTVRKLLWW